MRSLLIILGFLFLASIAPVHEHVQARRYYNNIEYIPSTICLPDTLLVKDSRHIAFSKQGLVFELPTREDF